MYQYIFSIKERIINYKCKQASKQNKIIVITRFNIFDHGQSIFSIHFEFIWVFLNFCPWILTLGNGEEKKKISTKVNWIGIIFN